MVWCDDRKAHAEPAAFAPLIVGFIAIGSSIFARNRVVANNISSVLSSWLSSAHGYIIGSDLLVERHLVSSFLEMRS